MSSHINTDPGSEEDPSRVVRYLDLRRLFGLVREDVVCWFGLERCDDDDDDVGLLCVFELFEVEVMGWVLWEEGTVLRSGWIADGGDGDSSVFVETDLS